MVSRTLSSSTRLTAGIDLEIEACTPLLEPPIRCRLCVEEEEDVGREDAPSSGGDCAFCEVAERFKALRACGIFAAFEEEVDVKSI